MASHFEFEAIGTHWKIDIFDRIPKEREHALLAAIHARIAEFDKAYSRFRDDSLVSEMARKGGEYRLPDDAKQMLDLYKELYDITDGLVTPLVGQVLVDAGYDAKYSLTPKSSIAPAKRWEDVLEYEFPMLRLKEPALLDFGALGKGYLIDIVAGIIRDSGVAGYLVDAGGDIAFRNSIEKPMIQVGLEDPQDMKKIVGAARISGESICGSAGNRRAWNKFHHIMNPKTVESPKHILGLWTVADTTLLADGLSTALFFVGPEKLAKYRFEFAILFSDRSATQSKGFPGNFFV
ncbi:MAG TPA: FAD:protein FMN transferase [Candidatus Paceibacterota bacterium]|nr:FAD:protein FMN transferase [Candidatus Paceibacterota bacterium]